MLLYLLIVLVRRVVGLLGFRLNLSCMQEMLAALWTNVVLHVTGWGGTNARCSSRLTICERLLVHVRCLEVAAYLNWLQACIV